VWILLPCPTAQINVNLTETSDTTYKNQADNKETKTDVISHRLFILLQVKFLKTAN
jgi:hypothetical protein